MKRWSPATPPPTRHLVAVRQHAAVTEPSPSLGERVRKLQQSTNARLHSSSYVSWTHHSAS